MTAPLDLNVLIVEDNQDFAEMILALLKHAGISGETASSGDQAKQVLQRQKPDLLLLDLNLGHKMSGWQVLDFVHHRYGLYSVPVIVVTACTDQLNRLVGRLQYVERYLTKPFTMYELYTVVSEVLELDKIGMGA